jgi:hypothetical protein
MNLQEAERESMDRVYVAKAMDMWRACECGNEPSRSIKFG